MGLVSVLPWAQQCLCRKGCFGDETSLPPFSSWLSLLPNAKYSRMGVALLFVLQETLNRWGLSWQSRGFTFWVSRNSSAQNGSCHIEGCGDKGSALLFWAPQGCRDLLYSNITSLACHFRGTWNRCLALSDGLGPGFFSPCLGFGPDLVYKLPLFLILRKI